MITYLAPESPDPIAFRLRPLEKHLMPRFVTSRGDTVFAVLILLSVWYVAAVPGVAAQQDRCAPVTAFLNGEQQMVTRVDADTLHDWRTGMTLDACRVTAAGTRTRSLRVVARAFYERLLEAGWTRTPNPADAPNESSLRFRLGRTDCLFNVYTGILLGTPSEIEVSSAVVRDVGERVYNVLVQCVPAMPARPPR